MTKFQKTIKMLAVTMLGMIMIAFLGCSGVIDAVLPCFIEEDAGIYAEAPLTSILPWTTIKDAERIMEKMRYVHETTQISLDRLKFDDERHQDRLQKIQARHVEQAKEIRDNLFDPSAPGGLLLATITGGAFGALAIRRPGDEKKKLA